MERKQITVTEVLPDKPVGDKGAVKHSLKGADNLIYFTFSKHVADAIKVGAVLDCEVEETKREYGGNTYTDRKITQVYVDGKPVAGQKQFFRTDPETQLKIAELNKASIQAQVAIKELGECIRSEHAQPSIPLKELYWETLRKWLGASKGNPSDAAFDALGSASVPNPPSEAPKAAPASSSAAGKPKDLITPEQLERFKALKWPTTARTYQYLGSLEDFAAKYAQGGLDALTEKAAEGYLKQLEAK